MNHFDLVHESNGIEGITRQPTSAELVEFDRFLTLERVEIFDLQRFVRVYQPNAVIRDQPWMQIRVGSHSPPIGGQHIVEQLQALLNDVNAEKVSAFDAHVQYERLHPFIDGNGRSGRMLWYWMHLGNNQPFQYGFLHWFYYEALRNSK